MIGHRSGALIAMKRLERDAREEALDEEEMLLARELEATRPRFRGDCEKGERPCPYLSCRHHLYLEVTEAGSIRLPFPGLELHELAETCSLDVADEGGKALVEVGALLAVTRERVRQIEERVLRRLKDDEGVPK